MGLTLKTMKRVIEVKHKRQDLFFKNRMKAHKGTQQEEMRAHIRKGIEILAPAAADQQRILKSITGNVSIKDKVHISKMEEEI